MIKFTPDPGDASSQVYQYAPLYGERPAHLRKTRDADTNRTFRVCGFLKWVDEYYIQPDQRNGVPMCSIVYYSLPTEWKDYEQWTGFGVMGNPQKYTSMETLFKIVDNNITEVSFIFQDNQYMVQHSRCSSKTVDELFNGIVCIPTPAEAAAVAAEIEKKRRAKVSYEKEKIRRFRRTAMNEMLGGNPDISSQAKHNLAIKLAQGDIDQETFNTAMNALN